MDEKPTDSNDVQMALLIAAVEKLPCEDNAGRIDKIRNETIPQLCADIARLQVYQVVTWTLLILIVTGLIGVAWKVLSAGGLP